MDTNQDIVFSDGADLAYAELPVDVNWLHWRRGNPKMASQHKTDPALYYGGWRAMVAVTGKDNEIVTLPVLPIPVVRRVGDDGTEYDVYATNALHFLPFHSRTRFELLEDAIDQKTGREYKKVIATATSFVKGSGYVPHRQVFGMVLSSEGLEYSYGVIKLYNWSSFISFNRAGGQWDKVKAPANHGVIRCYGNVGLKNGKPEIEVRGQGKSTPIHAIGLEAPRFVEVTEEIRNVYAQAMEWKECPRWNAITKVEPQAEPYFDEAELEEPEFDEIEFDEID